MHHSDRDAYYVAIRYTERLRGAEAVASVGTVGDSYGNAMADSFNSLYTAELIYNQGPWTGRDRVEFATMEYIEWNNTRRSRAGLRQSPHSGSRRLKTGTGASTKPGAIHGGSGTGQDHHRYTVPGGTHNDSTYRVRVRGCYQWDHDEPCDENGQTPTISPESRQWGVLSDGEKN